MSVGEQTSPPSFAEARLERIRKAVEGNRDPSALKPSTKNKLTTEALENKQMSATKIFGDEVNHFCVGCRGMLGRGW
jgi:hypothetical protein